MQKTPRPSPLRQAISLFIERHVPLLWMAAFLVLAMKGNSDRPPDNTILFTVAAAGIVYHLTYSADLLWGLVRRYRAIFSTALVLCLAILVSECRVQFAGLAPAHALPAQIALLLCLPSLAVFLLEPRRMTWAVGLFCAVSAWHIVMMPIEAITGEKVTWHQLFLMQRDAGPFKFRASGLAIAPFYFPGLMLPLFYLAWGPVYEKRVFPEADLPRRLMLALPLIWLIPVTCVQSRSAFFGVLVASLLLVILSSRSRHVLLWVGAMLVAGLGAAVYWYLFTEGKSGFDLRAAYLKFYVDKSLDWKWIATGHGFFFDPGMVAPGYQPLDHSHNDFVQILYSWGLSTLIAYLAFWAALLKLIVSRFATRGEYWPLAAVLAELPNMQTDLGFHHFEKAMFLILLTGLCVVFAEWDDRRKSATPPRGAADAQGAAIAA
jgi:hypothetical protein